MKKLSRFLWWRTIGSESEVGLTSEHPDDNPDPVYGYTLPNTRTDGSVIHRLLYGNRLRDAFISNGGRLYIDGFHPEYATPECIGPDEAARFTHGTDVLFHTRVAWLRSLGINCAVFRDNTDWHNSFYAMHENYQILKPGTIERKFSFAYSLNAYLTTQWVWGGAGVINVGTGDVSCSVEGEYAGEWARSFRYKAPYASARYCERYQRLQISGEANGLQEVTWLKFAITSLVISMIESDFRDWDELVPDISSPVQRKILASTRGLSITTLGGMRLTPLQIQRVFAESISQFLLRAELEGLTVPEWAYRAIDRFNLVLDQIGTFQKKGECKPPFKTDWLCKIHLMKVWKGSGERDTPQSRKELNMGYHDTDPYHSLLDGLYAEGAAERMFTQQQLNATLTCPSNHPRAKQRAEWYRKLRRDDSSLIMWDSVTVDGVTISLTDG